MKFREFLTSSTPDNYENLNCDNIILEAVLNPGELRLKNTDLEYLNGLFKKLNVVFREADYLSGKASTEKIIIDVPKDVNITELEAMIGHELIHREQHKRSKHFQDFTENIVKEINYLATKFNETQDMSILNKRNELLNYFLYGNVYEMMAYAYQLVKDRDSYNLNSPSDVINYFDKFLNTKVPKKFKKYVGMYWIIKEKL